MRGYYDKVTGRTRVRVAEIGGMFNKRQVVILQVETTWPDGPLDSNGLATWLRGQGWRDAKPEDLAQLAEIKGGFPV